MTVQKLIDFYYEKNARVLARLIASFEKFKNAGEILRKGRP